VMPIRVMSVSHGHADCQRSLMFSRVTPKTENGFVECCFMWFVWRYVFVFFCTNIQIHTDFLSATNRPVSVSHPMSLHHRHCPGPPCTCRRPRGRGGAADVLRGADGPQPPDHDPPPGRQPQGTQSPNLCMLWEQKNPQQKKPKKFRRVTASL